MPGAATCCWREDVREAVVLLGWTAQQKLLFR